jgi:hypothetical protein
LTGELETIDRMIESALTLYREVTGGRLGNPAEQANVGHVA